MRRSKAGLFSASLPSGPCRSCSSARTWSVPSAPSALPVATGSVASPSTRSCGRSPRIRSRENPAGMVTANSASPTSSIRSTSAWLSAMRTTSVVAGVLQRRDEAAGEVALVEGEDDRRQMLGVGVDRVAEQGQLHQRDAHHHREGEPVPAHLDELLGDHGEQAREREPAVVHAKLSREPPIRWMNTSSSEGGISSQVRPGSPRQRPIAASSAAPIGAADVKRRAERRHHLDPRLPAQRPGHRVDPLPFGPPGDQVGLREHLIDGALGQQPPIGDVGDPVAALGLVHVVGADQHGHARFGGEPVDLVPELAPRLRVDACGRLVQQQQLGLVQDGRGQRQPLLPAA